MTSSNNAAENPIQGLTNAAWLLYVCIHCPRMTFKVRGGKVSIDGIELNDKQVTPPQWKLMPQELKQELQGIQNAVVATLDRYRVQVRSAASRSSVDAFGNVRVDTLREDLDLEKNYLRSMHLIPDSRILACITELKDHNEQLRAIVQRLGEDMDRFRFAVEQQLNDPVAWSHAKKLLPTADDLLKKTGVEWVPIPIGTQNRGVQEANRGQIGELIRERMNAFMEGIVESIVAEPRQEVFRALKDLDDLITRDGRVTERSFVPVKRALEKLRSFDVADEELERRVSQLEDRMAVITPSQQTRLVAENNGLTTAIRNVMERARDENAIQEQYGRSLRGLDFDESPSFE